MNTTKIERNGNEVKITLIYQTTETPDYFAGEEELNEQDLVNLETSLKSRMRHCQDVLTKDILPQEDKVFSEYMAFSNTSKKHFSFIAMEAMENVLTSLMNKEFHLAKLSTLEALQCLKAVGSYPLMLSPKEEESKRKLIDALSEQLLVSCEERRLS